MRTLSSRSRPKFARLALLGALFTVLAFSGLGCPDGGSSSGPNSAPLRRSFVLVTNGSDNTLSRYVLDYAQNQPVFLGTTPVGKSPHAVVTARMNAGAQSYAYVANTDDNTISQFQAHTDGSLTPLDPPTVATGQGPVALATGEQTDNQDLSATLARVYCANQTGKSVSVFDINPDGTLHLVNTASMDSAPSAIAVNTETSDTTLPIQGGVYVVSAQDNTLSQFLIVPDAQGGIKRGTPFTFTNGSGKAGVDVFENIAALVINSDDKSYLDYTLNNPSGASSINKLAATQTTPDSPIALSADHSRSDAGVSSTYVAMANGTLYEYFLNNPYSDDFYNKALPVGAVVTQPTQIGTYTPQPVVIKLWNHFYLFIVKNFEGTLTTYYEGAPDAQPKTVPTGKSPTAIAILETSSPLSTVQTTVK